jgi:hypothetical protein
MRGAVKDAAIRLTGAPAQGSFDRAAPEPRRNVASGFGISQSRAWSGCPTRVAGTIMPEIVVKHSSAGHLRIHCEPPTFVRNHRVSTGLRYWHGVSAPAWGRVYVPDAFAEVRRAWGTEFPRASIAPLSTPPLPRWSAAPVVRPPCEQER